MSSKISSALLYTYRARQLLRGKSLASLLGSKKTFAEIFSQENDCWWVNCTNPQENEVIALSNALNLHPSTCDHILDGDVKEKFEKFEDYIFITYSLSSTENFYIITKKHIILTLQCNVQHDCSDALLSRLDLFESNCIVNAVTPLWMCHAFLDTLTDTLAPQITRIEQEASYIEKELFLHNGQSDVKRMLPKMCATRVRVVELMNLFQEKPYVIKGLRTHLVNLDDKQFSSEHLLTATEGHLNSMLESTYALESIITRSFVNYISIMRVKMVHSNSSMEQLVGGVGLIGLVLVPSHVIASAWSMNVPVPGQNYIGQGWFWGVVGLIAISTLIPAGIALWYYQQAVNSVKISRLIDLPRF